MSVGSRRGLPIRLLGTGVHRPARPMTSLALDALWGREAGTTERASGVRTRQWADTGETSSVMASAAVRAALARADLTIGDVDALIISSVVPEQPMPTTAVLTLGHLEAPGGRCEAFDVNASCVGFLTATQIAVGGLATGRWRRVVVAASEVASKGINPAQIESSSLFGDGAAAAVWCVADGDDGAAVLAQRSAVWPEVATACRMDAGGTRWNVTTPPPDPSSYLFHMEGAALLRAVARNLPGFMTELEAETGIGLAEIDVIVPHQASAVGLRYLRERLGARPEQVVDILADHGNQVSASIPTALHHAVASGRLTRGDTALLLGTGAGLALSATVLRY